MRAISLITYLFACCALFAQEGGLDPNFGQGGRTTFAFNGSSTAHDPTAVAVQSDGKILVAGFGFHLPAVATPHVCIARLLPGGSPDPTFSGDGKAGFLIDPNTANNIPRVMRVLSNGKILLFVTASEKIYFLRLQANGEPDSTFGTNGVVKIFSTLSPNAGFFTNHAMEVQTNGKIILSYRIKYTGINSAAQIVSRFSANGTPDNTFAGTGRLAVDSSSMVAPLTGPIEQVQLALLPGNKILLAGDTVLQSSPFVARIKLILLNNDGTFDQIFGTKGQTTIPNIQLQVNGMQVDASQNILVAGNDGGTNAVVKIKPNGSLETSYGTNGIAKGGAINIIIVNTTLLLNNGNTVFGGISNSFQTLCKSFDSQGFINNSFGVGGIAAVPQIGDENILRAMALQSDGKLILVGKRKAVSGTSISDFEVIRLNAATSAVQNVLEKNEFQIWPNPVAGLLHISLADISQGTVISLFSANGKLLHTQLATEGEQELDLKNLPSGNYFLQANLPGRVPVGKAFVKVN
ncbi:MAG: T9SS type A sorting domain-containing protein [Saprospiraceae bacterium]